MERTYASDKETKKRAEVVALSFRQQGPAALVFGEAGRGVSGRYARAIYPISSTVQVPDMVQVPETDESNSKTNDVPEITMGGALNGKA